MSAQTPRYESDALPTETMDAVVIGGGAAGLNGALMLARSRRSVVVIDRGTPCNAPAEAGHGFIVLDGTPPPKDWGQSVVHCSYCSYCCGWKVRDEPIGVLATGPASVHHA